jgi:formamidopyrimidine-DNA glycosylase
MPELPEVETMRRGILGVIGAKIVRAQRTPCSRKPISITPRIDAFNRKVTGQTVIDVGRLGKRVVVRLDNHHRLIFEPRMTGLVLISDPPTEEHLRFQLTLTSSPVKRLMYWDRRGLGNIQLLNDAQFRSKLNDGTLGKDALMIEPQEMAERFRHSRREVKVALLDQSAVAGIGNLYASEILHLAGVHPQAQCHRLSRKQWDRIHRCMRMVLETAIKYEGSTLSDGTYRNALNQSGSYQNEHRVYDREGQLCPACATKPIKRIVQAQRSTFFCSDCQRKR